MYDIIYISICIATAALALGIGYQMFRIAEYTICFLGGRIPFVPSSRRMRRAVADEICRHYPHARRICEIGSGYGGMARTIARRCNADIDALENMPFSVAVSRTVDFFTRTRSRTIWCDAFRHLESAPRYDIAVAYMGPGTNDRIASYRAHFKTLILLDVPANGITPTRVRDLGHGGTYYGRRRYPHKLFIYDFDIENTLHCCG